MKIFKSFRFLLEPYPEQDLRLTRYRGGARWVFVFAQTLKAAGKAGDDREELLGQLFLRREGFARS
ncbi:hypothetical protein A7K93_01850 [Candidatus Methylacidiphilum fumarolicum]|nr:hypothetical protein A7K73_01485 [Candidatus Methylacidiphilum fumarolicum]TFE75253.1 hypothetical protein A7K93_01850 [Candidatus Methylacidiphilum fumarolicum]TFE76135.1 hypothetical protein A7K72_00325 [Candidatus Methylacidiphilum fumarolicum]TFE77281.1 hypothetical protein A7D33_05600 [Candidatus Methylacidiphilum fumarolicum]